MANVREVQRVVVVLQSTAVGGMEAHVGYLAGELRRRGLDVAVVVPEAQIFDQLAASISAAGATVMRLDTDARRGRAHQVRSTIRLLRLLRDHGADVVHLHTGGATGGLIVVLASRLGSSATVVVTEHDVPEETPRGWDRWTRTLMDSMLHCLVAVSRRNAALRLERQGVRSRHFASILNGVPTPLVTDAERDANRRDVRRLLGIANASVVVGSVVRLAPGKGLHDLIRAFGQVQWKDAKLVLVGDGPLRKELVLLARELGVADRVRFAGHQQIPARFVDAMDVFVLAVPAGSMSIALLEAMTRGIPPVITFCGPEEAVVDERTGLCAPPNDPTALAATLDRLSCDADMRQRLGAAAATYVREQFSTERVTDDLIAVYGLRRMGSLPDRLKVSLPGAVV